MPLCGSKRDARGGLRIYSHVGSFHLPGMVWAMAEDPGDWQRDQRGESYRAGWLLVLRLGWPGLWFLELWESSWEGSGPSGAQAGCGAGGRNDAWPPPGAAPQGSRA